MNEDLQANCPYPYDSRSVRCSGTNLPQFFLKRAGVQSPRITVKVPFRRFLKGYHWLFKLVAFELLILYIVFSI